MTIKQQSREFNRIEKYLMTKSQDTISLKDVEDNTSIPVEGFLIYEDEKENNHGETERVEILSIITPEKKVYACQSSTFKKSLLDIVECMEGEPFSVIKFSGKSKANRDFIDCKLDLSSVQI